MSLTTEKTTLPKVYEVPTINLLSVHKFRLFCRICGFPNLIRTAAEEPECYIYILMSILGLSLKNLTVASIQCNQVSNITMLMRFVMRM